MNEPEEKYIYESPDGGDTVYRRALGSQERKLHSISDKKRQEMEDERLWYKWIEILRASRNDPRLRELLEQAEIYHSLKSQP